VRPNSRRLAGSPRTAAMAEAQSAKADFVSL